MKKRIGGLLVAAVAAALSQAPSSEAALVLDLRGPGGTKEIVLTPGQTGQLIPIQVWAVVTGAVGNAGEEGFDFAWYNIRSGNTTANLGDLTFEGLPNKGNFTSLIAPFDAGVAQAGLIADQNADGINDLGNTDNTRSVNTVRPGTPDANIVTTGGTNSTVANGREYLIQQVNFKVADLAALAGGSTTFTLSTTSGGFAPNFRVQEDGTIRSTGAYSGSTLTVSLVPEPASLSLLGLGALSLLGRRNRRK